MFYTIYTGTFCYDLFNVVNMKRTSKKSSLPWKINKNIDFCIKVSL